VPTVREAAFDVWRERPDYKKAQAEYELLNRLILPIVGHIDCSRIKRPHVQAITWLMEVEDISPQEARCSIAALLRVLCHAGVWSFS
jgi:hypothetical protein